MHVVLLEKGTSLVSRARGAAVREQVLRLGGGSEPIVLDFAGVRRASYSFVDELVGNLVTMQRRGAIAGPVEVVNTGDMIRFHVEGCLARRGAGSPLQTA